MNQVTTVPDLLGELEGMMDREIVICIAGERKEYQIREVYPAGGAQGKPRIILLCEENHD